MSRKTWSIGIVIYCLSLGGLTARAEAVPTLRLSDVLREAQEQSPRIRAARERARAAAAVPASMAAYEDPTLSYEAWNAPESFRLDRADNHIFKLSQRIPFPGKKSTEATAATRDSDRAAAQIGEAELDLAAAVKRAYYALWQRHQNLLVYSRDESLAERYATVAREKYAVGLVGQADALRAQVEVTRLVTRVATETLAIESARADLAELLSRDASVLGIPEEPAAPPLGESVGPLIDLALRQRPEVVAADAAIAAAGDKVRLSRLGYFPDFELTLERFVNSGARDGFGAVVSVSLPWAYAAKYDAAATEAAALLAAAKAEKRLLEDRVRREVTQSHLSARSALLERNLYLTTHLPQAAEALEASELGYQTGRVDLLSLIDSERSIESIHLEHIRAAADLGAAVAALERAVGAELPAAEPSHGEKP
jgi:outer membrane protein TolC